MGGSVSNTPSIPKLKFFIGDEQLPGRDSPLTTQSEMVPDSPLPEDTQGGPDQDEDMEAKARREREDPWACLPPLNLADVDWTGDNYEVEPPGEPTAGDVERLHVDHWSGVNGSHDHEGGWRGWSETISMPTYNDDLLHILPYVNLDL